MRKWHFENIKVMEIKVKRKIDEYSPYPMSVRNNARPLTGAPDVMPGYGSCACVDEHSRSIFGLCRSRRNVSSSDRQFVERFEPGKIFFFETFTKIWRYAIFCT